LDGKKRSLFVRRGKEGYGFGRGIGTPSRKPLLNISQQQNPVHGNIDKTAPFWHLFGGRGGPFCAARILSDSAAPRGAHPTTKLTPRPLPDDGSSLP